MDRTGLRRAAAALAAAALFAAGRWSGGPCLHGGRQAIHVSLTLFDQEGQPFCLAERSLCARPQGGAWQGHSTLPDGGEVTYSISVRQEGQP